MKETNYIGRWLRDWYRIFVGELKLIFKDSGVMVIFFVGGLLYPVLYNLIYMNGTVDEMPVPAVPTAAAISRRWTPRASARFSPTAPRWKRPNN